MNWKKSKSQEATEGIIESLLNGETVFYYGSNRKQNHDFKNYVSRKVVNLSANPIKNRKGNLQGFKFFVSKKNNNGINHKKK